MWAHATLQLCHPLQVCHPYAIPSAVPSPPAVPSLCHPFSCGIPTAVPSLPAVPSFQLAPHLGLTSLDIGVWGRPAGAIMQKENVDLPPQNEASAEVDHLYLCKQLQNIGSFVFELNAGVSGQPLTPRAPKRCVFLCGE